MEERKGSATFVWLPQVVVADMDGTFLASDKHVPSLNLRLLDALHEAGGMFVPCTGRPVIGLPPEVLAHPATRYAIGSNGAVVYDVACRAPLHVMPVSKESVLELYERVRGLESTFDVFADGEVFAERFRYDAMGSFGIDGPSLAVLRRVRKPVDLTVEQIVERVSYVEKITCFWHREHDRRELERAIGEVGGFSSAHGHPKNFELQGIGVSKGAALGWLCEHEGIDLGRAVAFGDEENDLPLLSTAGDGVAMANAIEAVRRAADHVTVSNDEAGVARYFMR